MTLWHRHRLPDGSTASVERLSPTSSSICRYVNEDLVWGQVFSTGDDHDAQVQAVLTAMRKDPAAFDRTLLWDLRGRAPHRD